MTGPATFQVTADTYIRRVEPRSGLTSPDVGGVAVFEPPEELDDFVVLRRRGHGAIGQVYLAEDSALARSVAIQLISADPDPAARQRS